MKKKEKEENSTAPNGLFFFFWFLLLFFKGDRLNWRRSEPLRLRRPPKGQTTTSFGTRGTGGRALQPSVPCRDGPWACHRLPHKKKEKEMEKKEKHELWWNEGHSFLSSLQIRQKQFIQRFFPSWSCFLLVFMLFIRPGHEVSSKIWTTFLFVCFLDLKLTIFWHQICHMSSVYFFPLFQKDDEDYFLDYFTPLFQMFLVPRGWNISFSPPFAPAIGRKWPSIRASVICRPTKEPNFNDLEKKKEKETTVGEKRRRKKQQKTIVNFEWRSSRLPSNDRPRTVSSVSLLRSINQLLHRKQKRPVLLNHEQWKVCFSFHWQFFDRWLQHNRMKPLKMFPQTFDHRFIIIQHWRRSVYLKKTI